MVDRDDEWRPPRPPSYTSDPIAPGDAVRPEPQPARPRTVAGPAAPSTSLWARLTLGRRILVSYVALVTAIVLVATVGGALQPAYGSLAPWKSIRVDDVRASPTASRWAVDLAAVIAPGTPPQCLRFATTDLGGDLVAVRADGSWAYGYTASSDCSVVPAGFGSRVVVLDTSTGDLRWVHDVADDFDDAQGASVTWMSSLDHGSRLLVRAGTATRQVIESLSLATGQVLDSTGPRPWSQDDRFTASGHVVATGSLSLDSLRYTYTLRDADDLSRVVWSGTGNETATLIALDDRLLIGGGGTLQVPLATGVESRWGGPVSTSSGYAVHDDIVYAADVTGDGVTTRQTHGFTARSRTGEVLWRSHLDLRGTLSVTRSCLAATNASGDTVTCLDYRTGTPLWTTRIGTFSFAGSAAGQRTDDVDAVTSSDQAELVAIDGRSGHVRYQAAVPAGSTPVASAHTVTYVLAYGDTGARSTVIAVDASSGRRLWTRSSQVQVGVWGGHVIDIGMDGLARRLDD